MRILIVHNSYQFRGGEDEAVAADEALLRSRGHETMLFHKGYDDLLARRSAAGPRVGLDPLWSVRTHDEIRDVIALWRPDVAHFHNIFPLISPSAYAACRAARIPVVQTLHNYRLVCPAGTLLREGRICELCVGKVPWRSVRYRCYRGSRLQSLALTVSLTAHRVLGTWPRGVDAYIALTEFGRRIFIRGGLPQDRIFVRPNAVRGAEPCEYAGPRSAVFVGRLSPEKGIHVLLDAWSHLPGVPLRIVGDGPLLSEVRAIVASRRLSHVEVLGPQSHDRVLDTLRDSGMLVFPSLWYEGLPVAILEALAVGLPVIASDLGAQAEVVRDGVNGLLFAPGDARALADSVSRLIAADGLAKHLARGARRDFEERYSPERSYQALMHVYARAGAPTA